jgi:DNA-directed RNA polymerase specialized sigma24 family protein
VIGHQTVAVEAVTDLEGRLTDFFRLHHDRLVRLAALVCHSPDSTEDAVQAAMEQAWRRRDTLRDDTRIQPWLDRIVVREAIRLNRRPWWSFPTRRDTTDVEPMGVIPVGVDPTWVALVEAFRGLPPEQRAVVALHMYAGYPVDETADLMGASLETTRSRLRLARRRLRHELGGEV